MIGTQSGAIGRNEMKITAERRPQNGGFCGCVLLLCRVQTMKLGMAPARSIPIDSSRQRRRIA
jgi:hypothetical protein